MLGDDPWKISTAYKMLADSEKSAMIGGSMSECKHYDMDAVILAKQDMCDAE